MLTVHLRVVVSACGRLTDVRDNKHRLIGIKGAASDPVSMSNDSSTNRLSLCS